MRKPKTRAARRLRQAAHQIWILRALRRQAHLHARTTAHRLPRYRPEKICKRLRGSPLTQRFEDSELPPGSRLAFFRRSNRDSVFLHIRRGGLFTRRSVPSISLPKRNSRAKTLDGVSESRQPRSLLEIDPAGGRALPPFPFLSRRRGGATLRGYVCKRHQAARPWSHAPVCDPTNPWPATASVGRPSNPP